MSCFVQTHGKPAAFRTETEEGVDGNVVDGRQRWGVKRREGEIAVGYIK